MMMINWPNFEDKTGYLEGIEKGIKENVFVLDDSDFLKYLLNLITNEEIS